MKRVTALLSLCLIAALTLSACSIFPFFKKPVPQPTQAAPTEAATTPATAPATAAPQKATEAATAAATQAPVGSLSDYVRNAKQASVTFKEGNTKTYRIPEIVLDSADAQTANKEIMERFGDDVREYTDYSPVISLDYEAYLNDTLLSVIVSGKYDGGNSYGLCYVFDVTSGNALNNATLCSVTARRYDDVLDTLKMNLTTIYDDRFGSLPGNDKERSKTLDSENIKAARLYLDGSGKLTAMADLYAAVGGGHWIESVAAE